MLEKDLHSRIENALSKILDDQRYVLDVTVDLKFTPTIKEEVTFRPGAESPTEIEPEADLPKGGVSAVDDKTSRITGLPIPGFEFGRYDEDEPAVEVPVDSPPTPTSGESNIVTQSYTDIKSSLPKVERMEIGCILPEGSAPELIENVRQIIMVASKFDRSRGDVLSIMTASFKERKDEKTAEAVIQIGRASCRERVSLPV
jgi:flagellar biosynthesis/type III secretory pathway M-ring protein FliF/YscJ